MLIVDLTRHRGKGYQQKAGDRPVRHNLGEGGMQETQDIRSLGDWLPPCWVGGGGEESLKKRPAGMELDRLTAATTGRRQEQGGEPMFLRVS